jgi:outer membrane receptor protein involved in Fe transport
MRTASSLLAVVVLTLAATVSAQTNPTGTLTGKVTDPDGLIMPGVTVTVTSPALQGERTAVTSGNGDYIIPFLPAGDYKVVYELSGFTTVERAIRLQVAETAALDVQLAVGGLAEAVTVTAEAAPADFTAAPEAAASYRNELIDRLPVSREITGAVLLAPGTSNAGPGGNITFSGALSYEGLFLLNGVVLNETLRNQARNLYVEDAIEEVKTSTGTISAEYGRFSGGVANMITKSGGNTFSGSFRTTLRNDKWSALTPYDEDVLESDPRVDDVNPTYEMTFGGPILKDRLWFFTAARFENAKSSETTAHTNLVYEFGDDDKRYEVKGTWAITPGHTVKSAFTKRTRDFTNNSFGTIMDLASLYDNSNPEDLWVFNYTGVLKQNFFLEGQYSRRHLSFVGSGSRFTDIEQGTMILDRARGSARWNSPTFCAVCGDLAPGELNEELRDNWNAIVKGTYYLSTDNLGAHTIVGGFDSFEDTRQNDNWQSGSEYRLFANDTIIRDGGAALYPVVRPGTTPTQSSAAYIQWNPIFSSSVGSALRTYSAFLNDTWRLSNHWTLNLGVRWDRTDAKDQAGEKVSEDNAWSPRLAASWDPTGTGTWTVNTGFARYAMGVTSGIADLGSGAGRSSTFTYVYMGPAINTDPAVANPVTAAAALRTVFDWFNANGGTTRPLRGSPTYAGVNRIIGDDLVTPSAWEYTVGFARQLGSRGSFRVDGIFREYRDFYAEQKDLTTGRVADPSGRLYDLGVVINTNEVERDYRALQTQIQYRFTPTFFLGGNYTLSNARGNFNGETEASGPDTADALFYPEYRQKDWNYPVGDMAIDQRHKLRLWATYLQSLGAFGRLDFGLLQNITSGDPQSIDAAIDSRPYVTNPGYLTPPSTVTYYFGPRGGYETDTVSSTDLSINYIFPVGFLGPKSEFFLRFVVDNLFNQSAIDGPNDTVQTVQNDSTLRAFNPFTETPVEGVHYRLGPSYGQALSADAYQQSRTFYFSGGFRF